MPSAALFLVLLLAAIVLAPFVEEQPPDSFGFVRPAWFSLPVAIAPFIVVSLWISIYVFNRPKFLVPPHLRDDRASSE